MYFSTSTGFSRCGKWAVSSIRAREDLPPDKFTIDLGCFSLPYSSFSPCMTKRFVFIFGSTSSRDQFLKSFDVQVLIQESKTHCVFSPWYFSSLSICFGFWNKDLAASIPAKVLSSTNDWAAIVMMASHWLGSWLAQFNAMPPPTLCPNKINFEMFSCSQTVAKLSLTSLAINSFEIGLGMGSDFPNPILS